MANFNTHLRKDQILDALNGGLNAVQPDDLASVATSGRYADLLGKPIVDESPTENSENLVSSGGVASTIKVISNAVAEQIDSGAKNRLKLSASSLTHNGITFTVGDDGTVTANGTATANAYIQLATIPPNGGLFDGTYRLSGCPSGGSNDTYALYAAVGGYSRYDYGSSISLTPTQQSNNVGIVAIVYAGTTVENLTFRPMICSSAYWAISQEYAPYCPTMPELYQMILALGG